MQNILCYDLAPSHGAVVLIDSELSVMIIIAEMKNQKHIHNLQLWEEQQKQKLK